MLAAPVRAFSIAALVLLFTPAVVHSIYQDDIDSIERFVGATNEAASDGMPYKVAPNRNHGVIVLAQAQTPSNTCARERTACLQAHVREGSFGSRYVPPDEGAECEAAYQACLNPDACTRGRAACLKGAVRRTTAGVEYVPPDDLARCNETYRACAPGGAAATPKSAQPAARPPVVDINGAWGSNIGVNYQITQTGNSFRWVCGIPGETGNGTIEGNKVSASWSGPSGSGSASGVVVVVGRPTRIEWSNGVIFLRR